MKQIATILICVFLSTCSSRPGSQQKIQNKPTKKTGSIQSKRGFSYVFSYPDENRNQIIWLNYFDNKIEFELESRSNRLTGIAKSLPNQGDGESLGNENGELTFVEEFEFIDSSGCHLIIRLDTEDFSLAQLNRVNGCKGSKISELFQIGKIMKRV